MKRKVSVSTTGRKRGKQAQPSRVAEFFSAIGHFCLGYALSLSLIMVALVFAGVMYRYYYHENDAFTVTPSEIVFRGSSMYSREMLLSTLQLEQPKNGFEIVRSDVVARLQREMPSLKSVQMTYEPGKLLEIWVVERTPIARLARPTTSGEYWRPLAVDDEGVAFVYPRSLAAYPEIGDQEYAKLTEPGDRLPADMHCMLHLIQATAEISMSIASKDRPSSIKKISQLSNDTEDGLLVALVDGRKIKIAWPGMSSETGISEEMVQRLQNVAMLLKNPLMVGQKHFNAMAPDRVAVSE